MVAAAALGSPAWCQWRTRRLRVAAIPRYKTRRAEGKAKLNPLNKNFDKQEFQELWNRINQKAAYAVHFDTKELVGKCVKALDVELAVSPLQYTVIRGEQESEATVESLKSGEAFKVKEAPLDLASEVHQVRYNRRISHPSLAHGSTAITVALAGCRAMAVKCSLDFSNPTLQPLINDRQFELSEKGNIGFWIGMTFAALAADEVLRVPRLIHAQKAHGVVKSNPA